MKTLLRHSAAAAVTFLSGAALAFNAQFSDVVTTQDDATGEVTVRYRLTGEACVVTMDVQTNRTKSSGWFSLADTDRTGIEGDVWKVIEPTTGDEVRTITWKAVQPSGARPIAYNGHVRTVLTAWSTNAPPEYLVIHLRDGKAPEYFTSEALLPHGSWVGANDPVYKDRDYMLFKRIHAAGVTWTMGFETVERGKLNTPYSTETHTTPHRVMLTHDYYIGVFKLTYGQYCYLFSRSYNYKEGPAMRMPGETTYANCRGKVKGVQWPVYKEDGSFDYDASHQVDEYVDGASGDRTMTWCLRRAAGFDDRIDLPTAAQWEFAARGGCRRELPNGKDFNQANLDECCLNGHNRSTFVDCEGQTSGSKAVVGSFPANDFGLYDVIGNVFEQCLDRYEDWSTCEGGGPLSFEKVYVDPVGARTGDARETRGGYVQNSVGYGACPRLSVRQSYGASANTGFRFVLNLR